MYTHLIRFSNCTFQDLLQEFFRPLHYTNVFGKMQQGAILFPDGAAGERTFAAGKIRSGNGMCVGIVDKSFLWRV